MNSFIVDEILLPAVRSEFGEENMARYLVPGTGIYTTKYGRALPGTSYR